MAERDLVPVDVLAATLRAAAGPGGAFAEVFVSDARTSSATLEGGAVRQFRSGRDRGAGIRVVHDGATGFAHTADLSPRGLLRAGRAAAVAAGVRDRGGDGPAVELADRPTGRVRSGATRPGDTPKAARAQLLRDLDATVRHRDQRVVQVSASYADTDKRTLVANTDGILAADHIVRTQLRVAVLAAEAGERQSGSALHGLSCGIEAMGPSVIDDIATEATRQAVTKLGAAPAPSGPMPVVFAAGAGGVLFHEACGHGLEADLVDRGMSVYRDRLGAKVAADHVTVVDDGTMEREWGTLAIDDEGCPTRRNVLIGDGVLVGYMCDRLGAAVGDRRPSGNGRRQSYMQLPMVRMTNTLLAPGPDDPDEIVRSTRRGVYVAGLGGGQVDTTTGDFAFGLAEAYLIENGRVTAPVGGCNLVGNGPDVLVAIENVGSDFAMGQAAMCGKDGQSIPVGHGTPTVKVRELTVAAA